MTKHVKMKKSGEKKKKKKKKKKKDSTVIINSIHVLLALMIETVKYKLRHIFRISSESHLYKVCMFV